MFHASKKIMKTVFTVAILLQTMVSQAQVVDLPNLEENPADLSLCKQDICVGEIYRNMKVDNLKVKVVGIQPHGAFVLEFLEGHLQGGTGGGWGPEHLAQINGCSPEGVCINEIYKDTDNRNMLVKIVGLQPDGRFIVEFLEGTLRGAIRGGWSAKYLVQVIGR